MRCRECEYIDTLLRTCKASDQAILSVGTHLHDLHREIFVKGDMVKQLQQVTPAFIGDNIGIYCKDCTKPHLLCLCREHQWHVKEEKIDS